MKNFLTILALLLAWVSGAANETNFYLGRPLYIGLPLTTSPSAGGGGGFTYYSTAFTSAAGNSLTRNSILTGLASGKAFTISCWVKAANTGSSEPGVFTLAESSLSRFTLSIYWTTGIAYISARDSSGTQVYAGSTTAASFTADTWHHIYCSFNTATSAHVLYLDGTSNETGVTMVADGIVDMDAIVRVDVAAFAYGARQANALISELWFSSGYTATPTAWRSSTHPADLGSTGNTPTGSAPLVYLRNPYGTFNANLGTGGNFTSANAPADGGADLP